jgi:uncharacterized protein
MKSTSIISLILTILSLLIVTVGCCPSSNGSPTTSTQVSYQQEVEDLIKNSSTFKFDGITGSIKSVKTVSSMEGTATIPAKDWELTVKYQTSHPGHGDRTGQVLAQVITNHTAVINIENGVITSAICDNIWNIQDDKRLIKENETSPFNQITQEESRQIAGNFVKNCATFKFDGIEDTLKFDKVDILRTPFGWQFTFKFQSKHAGYGDRTGKILTQVITPHEAIINVEQGKITEAVMDEKWDMINQKMLESSTLTQTNYPIINENVGWQIGETAVAATITRPDDQVVHPAVVFVAGSGPTDRDWNSPLLPGTNGSARLLAEELAKIGFVTIRYDKRIAGPNAQNNLPLMMGKISMEGHIEELVGAVDTLIARPDVNPDKIFVLANSEGTIHALNYQQTREPKFAGLILSAMPGRNLADVIHSQLAPQVASLPNAEEIMAGYDKLMTNCLAGKPFEADPTLPQWMNDFVQSFYAPINLPFTIEFLSLNPAPMLGKVTVPTLVITGKKDIQVDPLLDGIPLESAAKGLDNISFVYPENANHVLKYETRPRETLTGADGLKYNVADQILDPDSLQIIKNWLMQNIKTRS